MFSDSISNGPPSEDRNRHRIDHLQKVCNSLLNNTFDKCHENSCKGNLFNVSHDIVYCSIEKSGSTFWRRILQVWTYLLHNDLLFSFLSSKRCQLRFLNVRGSVKMFCHSIYFSASVIAEYFKISVSERTFLWLLSVIKTVWLLLNKMK